jgi:hypothetical protein
MRDVGGATLNLQSTALKGKEYEVISNAFIALKSVYQDLRLERAGKNANSKWAEIFEEFDQNFFATLSTRVEYKNCSEMLDNRFSACNFCTDLVR